MEAGFAMAARWQLDSEGALAASLPFLFVSGNDRRKGRQKKNDGGDQGVRVVVDRSNSG